MKSKPLISENFVDVLTIDETGRSYCSRMTTDGLPSVSIHDGDAENMNGRLSFFDVFMEEDLRKQDFKHREMLYHCLVRNYISAIADCGEDEKRAFGLLLELNREIEGVFNKCRFRFDGLQQSCLKFNWRNAKDDSIFKMPADFIDQCQIYWQNGRIYSFRGKYYTYNPSIGSLMSDNFTPMTVEFILNEECLNYSRGAKFSIVEQIVRNGVEYCRVVDSAGRYTTIRSSRGRISACQAR